MEVNKFAHISVLYCYNKNKIASASRSPVNYTVVSHHEEYKNMQFIILAALAATAAAAPQYYDSNVNMTSIYTCGSQPYRPEAYTCYDNTVLCPVINDRRQEACAGGCYDPMFYG